MGEAGTVPRLPVGYHRFHRGRFLNYQLNRLHSLGYMPYEDLMAAAGRIRSFADWQREFSLLGDKAAAQGWLATAAFSFRAAEFLTAPSDPQKGVRYERFLELFDAAFSDEDIERHRVPYPTGRGLPALRVAPPPDGTRGTVVIHGGFDSFIEEFVAIFLHLAAAGYEVIAFEGPGQGGALRHEGLMFDHDWEKPTAAVLDHFDRADVTLLGISMGGYWCLRAAAFEPRVTRVIVMASVLDWLAQLPVPLRAVVRRMVRWRRFMNASIRVRMRLVPVLAHAIAQGLLQIGGEEPMDFVDWLLEMNAGHQHPERVTQDVLLMHGAKDRFQPLALHHAQRRALTNARSVSERIFTEDEHAASHCQMGNLDLAVSEILRWLDRMGGHPNPDPSSVAGGA